MDTPRLVFLDEVGFIIGMNRLYGWALEGEQAVILRETRGKRLNAIGAMAVDGGRGFMSFEGRLNSDLMVAYIEHHLAPNLDDGDIVVMDGCPVHRSAAVREAFDRLGVETIILPPYSPELNPIEHLWSTLKARVRGVGATAWEELERLVHETWSSMELPFYQNWIRHCGYVVEGTST